MIPSLKPRRIHLEASSLCQLRCPSCPNTTGLTDRIIRKGSLDPDLFATLLDRNPFIGEVELSSYGEMFLNPRLTEIMEEAYRRQIRLTADNGVNLNTVREDQLEGLIRFGFRSLTVSLDGTSLETYKKYRMNGDFDSVISHIGTINRLKKQFRSPFPLLTWQFVVFGHNEHQVESAKKMAKDLGMRFYVKLSWDECFSPIQDHQKIRSETGYSSREEYRTIHGIDPAHGTCNMLWERPQVNWDGRVMGCSRNFWGEFGGNVFTDGLLDCINSPGMHLARQMLMGKIEIQENVPCATCQIYRDRLATGRFVNRTFRVRTVRRITRRFRSSQPFRNLFHRISRKIKS